MMTQSATKNSEPASEGASNGANEMALIRRTVTDERVCVLTFDRPNASVNLFDRETLEELDRHLDHIVGNSDLRGLILFSAKKSIFIAGADIQSLSRGVNEADLRHLIQLGQAVFNRIAKLSIPTVAAIHGACLGGGYEVALACNYRLASSEKATKVGLPETKLGILPAWGGSTRLPRLIGLPAALDIILGGKALSSQKALRRGMVDEVVPREYLLELAEQRILSGKASVGRRRPMGMRVTTNGLAARLIAKRVRPGIERKTGGHYPAITKALEVVTQGVSKTIEGSLALEVEAIVELARTPVCRNLIGVFFMQERAKKITGVTREQASQHLAPVSRAAVVGAGVMGAGIAQWCSARGVSVLLKDINPEQVNKGMATIAGIYDQGVKRHVFTPVEARAGMDRISPTAVDVPMGHVDLVIEAAVEKMELKKRIFTSLEQQAGPHTILATNTSALSVTELAASLKKPERVLGIHFFNPVHRMQLVEVVVGKRTSPEVVQRAVRFVQAMGKLPVVVKDSPGFLVNRVLMPYLIEAGHLFESGAAVTEIDKAMLEFGMPMGPLRLIDEVGVDVSDHVAETLAGHFSERLQAPNVLRRMVDGGFLGRKSGRGFYVYEGKGKTAVNEAIQPSDHPLAGLGRAELRDRMVLLMVNEAARCVEEGVVETAEDADFGMIMGTGFAPFLGGPLRLADAMGAGDLVERMGRLAESGEARFAPCELLVWMAARGKTFYDR